MENYQRVPVKRSKKNKKNPKMIIVVLIVIAVVLGIVAIIIHFSTRLTDSSFENCAIGDVNGDGYINSEDALLTTNYISGGGELFESQVKLADVNQDTEVNSKDVLILLKYAVGEIKTIPYLYDDAYISEGSRTAKINNGKISVDVQITNDWKNADGTKSYQLSISTENVSQSSIDGWKINLAMSNSVNVSKSWECKCSASGTVLTISGESLSSDSTEACGLIVTSADELKILSIETE